MTNFENPKGNSLDFWVRIQFVQKECDLCQKIVPGLNGF